MPTPVFMANHLGCRRRHVGDIDVRDAHITVDGRMDGLLSCLGLEGPKPSVLRHSQVRAPLCVGCIHGRHHHGLATDLANYCTYSITIIAVKFGVWHFFHHHWNVVLPKIGSA